MGASILDYTIIPLILPFVGLWWLVAFIAGWLATFAIIPSALLAQRLYWACPFIPHIWGQFGPVRGLLVRIGFEASYCINVTTRFLTLPLRRQLPAFHIVGFPKCGTTSLAEHLKRHPGLSGVCGLPYHDTLSKESHFFAGVLGRGSMAHSAAAYRSFFPTFVTRWWAEAVVGVEKWMCFDACPVHACLPFVAERIAALSPNAKIIIMMRDPVPGVFSAEVMMRNMGVPLPWTLSDQVQDNDSRFKITKEEYELWETLKTLGPTEALPAAMPELFYFRPSSILQCGQYATLVEPYMRNFPPENILFLKFEDFVANTEAVVLQVLQFVGADMRFYSYAPLPPSMQNDYKGRQMHPTVKEKLRTMFLPGNRKLYEMLRRDMAWGDVERAV
ncbi:MAG: hypothetical protein WDW38_011357 [Sanguina aurantia]